MKNFKFIKPIKSPQDLKVMNTKFQTLLKRLSVNSLNSNFHKLFEETILSLIAILGENTEVTFDKPINITDIRTCDVYKVYRIKTNNVPNSVSILVEHDEEYDVEPEWVLVDTKHGNDIITIEDLLKLHNCVFEQIENTKK